jgi:hypothetical protein
VEPLHRATQWVPKYLEYDDKRGLAVNAIWALGNIGNSEAKKKLEALTPSA